MKKYEFQDISRHFPLFNTNDGFLRLYLEIQDKLIYGELRSLVICNLSLIRNSVFIKTK